MTEGDFDAERKMDWNERTEQPRKVREEEALRPACGMTDPNPAVMETLEYVLARHKDAAVLDLCCGAGANAIPMAMRLQEVGEGSVNGMDASSVAIGKLKVNAAKYGVGEIVHSILCDANQMNCKRDTYDYVVACGCLEQLSSQQELRDVISRLQDATREGGVHCIAMSSQARKFRLDIEGELLPLTGLDLEEGRLESVFRETYSQWEFLRGERDLVPFGASSYLLVFQKNRKAQ